MNDGIMRPMHRPGPTTLARGALLVMLAAGIAGCQLLPFGDRMPDPAASPADRSQEAEGTTLPAASPDGPATPAPPAETPAPGEPSPSLEIPPPIN